MGRVHVERAFEDAVEADLVASGWRRGQPGFYDRERGLDTGELFAFIGATQADEWSTIVTYHAGDPDAAQREFVKLLVREIDARGTLDVLRHGVRDRGVLIRLAYFRPAALLTEDALAEYEQNRLSVVRQLHYSVKDPEKSLDLVLFVNGLPVATAELKNPLTGQTVEDAKKQYRAARDPKEPLFARRTLVHFAVDPDLVFLTTKLARNRTRFLPFNRGTAGPGQPGGAGNPAAGAGDYRTAYLWRELWHPDNWLELLQRFLHVENPRKAGRATGTRLSVHEMPRIFPRFHQWHAVRELVADAGRHGPGRNYLVMHSAGSGKSNTIAWLAHRLSTLHAAADPAELDSVAVRDGTLRPAEPVFDKVIVVTDRDLLDRQLGDTIYQFDHTSGVVQMIRGSSGSKSAEVRQALEGSAARIIIVTMQTFPYVLAGVAALRDRRLAVIHDEAHSGLSGDSRTALTKVLRGLGSEEIDEDADPLTASALARGRQGNLSTFAFTATPKPKTLELFGAPDSATGNPRPFHVYSMHQAIEEGFILDVLRNYVTYKTYWKLANANPDDPEVDPDKASSHLARFVYLHDSTMRNHAEVIVEHFQAHTARRLGGRAKAMVVTRSRESAVRMYRALRTYIADLGYRVEVLVAFSDTLKIDGEEVTESQFNGISEKALPAAFAYTKADDPHAAARDQKEFRILVVADKYQTGFDQPLLTTMYVEKPLRGVAAVQTLSRLNRTHPLKSQDDVFVLDFANEAEAIQESFKPYFEEASTTPSDPNLLYTAQRLVMDHQLLVESEMDSFAQALLAVQLEVGADEDELRRRHGALYRFTEPARDRFVALQEEDPDAAAEFVGDLRDYLRKYGFLAQILPPEYVDRELERLYLYGKHLLNRLPRRQDGGVDVGELDLTHLRVAKTGEHDVSLTPEGEQMLPGFADGAGGGADDPRKLLLSEIIQQFNERYGVGLSDADKLMVEERIVAVMAEKRVQQAAVAASEDAFVHEFDQRFEDVMVERAESNMKFTERFFGDEEFKSALTRDARRAAYRMIRRNAGLADTG